jgi:hypothetical protein
MIPTRAGPPARPTQSSAERPASKTPPEVWLRDASGDGARRIPRERADGLVLSGIAERVSAAGHVRLRLGIRPLGSGDAIHGLPAVETSRLKFGDAATARGAEHHDRARLRWVPPAAKAETVGG